MPMHNIDELIHDLNDFISRVNSGKGIDRAVAAKNCAEAADAIIALCARADRAEQERDAAVNDLREYASPCELCKNNTPETADMRRRCDGGANWQYRGIPKEGA
jgi:hypothetical protein